MNKFLLELKIIKLFPNNINKFYKYFSFMKF